MAGPDSTSPSFLLLPPPQPTHGPHPVSSGIESPTALDSHESNIATRDNVHAGSSFEHRDESVMDEPEEWFSLDNFSTMGDQGGVEDIAMQEQESENTEYRLSQGATQASASLGQEAASESAKPFQRWVRTLQKRAARRREMPGLDGNVSPCLMGSEDGDSLAGGSAHPRPSSSSSSFGFVTAVKSASISLAGASMLTRSKRNTVRSARGQSRTDCSSRASVRGPRRSEDSFCPDKQAPMDPAVIERSLQRRRILEELISTEESYIGDVRFLMNVYVTILASLPTSPPGLRSSVNRNLTEIVELHEEILGELHRAVPHSEYTQLDLALDRAQIAPAQRGHRCWKSLDAVPEDDDPMSRLQDVPGMVAEPQTAAEVAKIFLKKMNRFFIYEEYGAKYELMIKDVAAAHRTIPGWPSYQKGLEVLAATVGSEGRHKDRAKKSLTIGDLLVKPIQRVCKYPLLFSMLLKHTPVIDCPYSYMEIENTLVRLREATAAINRATDDPRTRIVLEKTWILQDRLVFPNQWQLDGASRNRVRSFGHIQLCGVLHVCWQTRNGVNGQYMVALLYREWFCLAIAGKADQVYTVQACIALANIKLEEVDNGRGIQCHTARHSWKIVFLCDNQLYELMLTACSPKEETEWRTRLRNSQAANADGQGQMQPEAFSFLSLNIRTLGTVFRKPGTIAREVSIHRATTVGSRSPLCHVVLKNTSVAKEASASSRGSQINRSQSLLTNSRIPVLAPSRAERARLEALLSDVWTRDVLPFPGITTRSRSEQLVRASASSVMRKLSVVSITSTFMKRSTSAASLQQQKDKGGSEGGPARTSEAAQRATTTAPQWQQSHDRCASPVLSSITDRTEMRRSQSFHTANSQLREDVDYFGTVVRRRFHGSASREDASAEGSEQPPSSSRPSSPGMLCESPGTSTPCRLSLQQSVVLGETSAAAAAASSDDDGDGGDDTDAAARERGSESSERCLPSQSSSSPQHPHTGPGKAPSRSQKLSDKLAKVGVRHREVVVQGFRNLFR